MNEKIHSHWTLAWSTTIWYVQLLSLPPSHVTWFKFYPNILFTFCFQSTGGFSTSISVGGQKLMLSRTRGGGGDLWLIIIHLLGKNFITI